MTGEWSLRSRLLRRHLVGVTLGWLAGLGIGMFVIAHEMTELLDETLKESARVALAVHAGAGDLAKVALDERSAIRITHDGQKVGTAPWPAQSKDGSYELDGWRIYRLSTPAGDLAVEVGQSSVWRRDELVESVEALLILMLPVLLAVLLTVRHSTAAALRPALRFAGTLQSRPATDLSPLVAPDLPTELKPIPQSLNMYLERIGQYIEAERQFATNAAHELRTPLAAASAQAQLISAGLADPGAPRRMAGAIDRLGRIVERLLQLSRAEAGIGADAQCDLLRVLRMVMAELPGERPAFDDGDLEVAPVQVHPDAVALLVGNALRNAREHGTGSVQVTLRPGPVLTIRNPVGPEAAFRPQTFEKSATSDGAGLGMTIMQTIAERNGIGLGFSIDDGVATVRLDFSGRVV